MVEFCWSRFRREGMVRPLDMLLFLVMQLQPLPVRFPGRWLGSEEAVVK